jgi:hypothetical protein
VAQETNGHQSCHLRRSLTPLVLLLLDPGQPRGDGAARLRSMAGAAQQQWHIRHAYASATTRSDRHPPISSVCLLAPQKIPVVHTCIDSVSMLDVVAQAASLLPAATPGQSLSDS